MKKDVLFVIDERQMGGVCILLSDILQNLDLKKYNIDVLVLHNNGEMLSDLPKGINLIFGPSYFDTVDVPFKMVLKSFNIRKILNKFRIVLDLKTGLVENRIKKIRSKLLPKKYDVEVAFKDGYTALFTIFGDSKRKIHWIQYTYKKEYNPNKKYDALFKRVLPGFDSIVSVSKKTADEFNNLYHLDSKTKIIPNLVNQDRIKVKSKEECDLKLEKNKINLVSVGRLHFLKGYDRLIECMHLLDEEHLLKNVKLDIYGDGPEKENLINLIDNYNLSDYIELKGKVTNPYKYLKNYDLFVLSSRNEAFGLVIVEAMTLGVPVLACQNEATGTLIKNNINGIIVNNDDKSLYNELKSIVIDSEKIINLKDDLKNYKYNNDDIIKAIDGELDGEEKIKGKK